MSVDVRSRIDGQEKPVDPAEFFGITLPEAFAVHEVLLATAAKWLAPAPLAIAVGGSTWTLALEGCCPTVVTGTHPATSGDGPVLDVTAEQLSDLVNDQATPMGLFSSGNLKLKGHLSHLQDWWLLVRGALDAMAPTTPGEIDLVGSDGSPLDLTAGFTLDDDPQDMAYFLEQAGYLHIRGVFTEDEMAQISADMDSAAGRFTPGDGRSWWATTSDGTERLVRMQRFDEISENVAALIGDARLMKIAGLTNEGHDWSDSDLNRIEALFKPIGVVQGISDVPWHKDCSLGRHSYECSSLTIGISVTGAGPGSGQLQVMAGSHRAHMWPALLQPDLDLPMVALATRTGDVTVHLSCTLHMAEPPVDQERRVLYTGLRLPPLDPKATADARMRLGVMREAASVSVSQPPSPVAAAPR